jgi:hypothetical protein
MALGLLVYGLYGARHSRLGTEGARTGPTSRETRSSGISG